MPTAIVTGVAWIVSNGAALLGASVATQAVLAGAVATTLGSTIGLAAIGLGLSMGVNYLTSSLFGSKKPNVPKPEDGKQNLKQNVPVLSFAYGRVKKGGDFVFLEERDGVAYNIIVLVAHSVRGNFKIYLNDTPVRLNGDGWVTGVESADEDSDKYYVHNKVKIQTRTGLAHESAYPDVVSKFSDIWSPDHRGDGLTSVFMSAKSVDAEKYTTVFPVGLPAPVAAFDAKDDLFDPRSEQQGYSENLALIRLDHLTAPFGGKLTLEDINLESFAYAATVCDELTQTRNGTLEPRYYGGFFAGYDVDPVAVGRTIDQAADLVLYEDNEGKMAVHAGEWVEPDIHIKDKDILECDYKLSLNPLTHIEAVRGRWTNPRMDYNTEDAAIFGNPYVSENDERSSTLDNVSVQRHNHMQRLQKLAFIRQRAPQVALRVDYFAAVDLNLKRFVRVTKQPQMNAVCIEIKGVPKLRFSPQLCWEFEGLEVPDNLYAFDPLIDEGTAASTPDKIGSKAIPAPQDFSVVIKTQSQSGASIAYAEATFTRYSDALKYELEEVLVETGQINKSYAESEDEIVRSSYLVDGAVYRFRLRARSTLGVASEWTAPITLAAVADPTAPPLPENFSAQGGEGTALLLFRAANSANFGATQIYRGTNPDQGDAQRLETVYSGPSLEISYEDNETTPGLYYYWASSLNRSGVESDLVIAADCPVEIT
ncbi:phage tail protein [Flexibacterium corallicola]|uniref:hypothetical protein n=1 Tax=Flexibacterium corallicola TaxID=3037259 RepID=UPI00286EFC20|nr:hypothetical protein [Pseudovibrio sp. M1P-2-3]